MITYRNQVFFSILFLLLQINLKAQQRQITIEECFSLARQNYPLIKKKDLIVRSSDFSLDNVSKTYLPQINFSGQATYQSQTINFAKVLPASAGTLPSLSKDQYKIQGEVSQLIFDGGMARNQKQLIRANEAVQLQTMEVSLNSIKERVTQIYFSILLLQGELTQNEIRKSDLQGSVDKANAALQNGTSFKSNVDELKAEVINSEMKSTELKATRKAFIEMLSLFIGEPLDETTTFILPATPEILAEIKRPELKLYDLQKKVFDVQETQLRSEYLPKINAFVQGAYGRPTLNFIENKFGAWWIGGIRFNWSLAGLYTLKNNRRILNINRQNVDIDKDVFLLNTNITLAQQNGEIKKYSTLLNQDDTVIALRHSVRQSAQAQLDNDVITVHEYIAKLNAENQAKETLILHKIQLLQALYNYKNTTGN